MSKCQMSKVTYLCKSNFHYIYTQKNKFEHLYYYKWFLLFEELFSRVLRDFTLLSPSVRHSKSSFFGCFYLYIGFFKHLQFCPSCHQYFSVYCLTLPSHAMLHCPHILKSCHMLLDYVYPAVHPSVRCLVGW